jgi:glycerate kinase
MRFCLLQGMKVDTVVKDPYFRDINSFYGILSDGKTAIIEMAVAKLEPGSNIILECVDFDKKIEDANLIVTGEGKIDGQSLRGKVPVGIAKRVQNKNVPVIAVVGDIGDDIDKIYMTGLSAVFSINHRAVPFNEAKLTCREDLMKTVESIMRFAKVVTHSENWC